jgi:hypothetical protein
VKHLLKFNESNSDIVSEVSDILSYLSDDGFEISVDRLHDIDLSILIDRLEFHEDGSNRSRGMLFKISDISKDIEELYNQISDRYAVRNMTVGLYGDWKKYGSWFYWNDLKSDIDYGINFFKIQFDKIDPNAIIESEDTSRFNNIYKEKDIEEFLNDSLDHLRDEDFRCSLSVVNRGVVIQIDKRHFLWKDIKDIVYQCESFLKSKGMEDCKVSGCIGDADYRVVDITYFSYTPVVHLQKNITFTFTR